MPRQMKMKTTTFVLAMVALVAHVSAQFPSTPSGLSIATSKLNKEVKISYKQARETHEHMT